MNLVWGCSSKVNTVDYKSLKHMKAAGCIQLDFGVEKASDEQMHLLKKGTKVREVKETFKNCHKLGIRAFANMLINTPGETEKDLKAAFPIETWNRVHLQIIFFGRKYCPARGHNALACPICKDFGSASLFK